MAGIEDWLPAFHVGERHEIDVALPPEQALRQALAAPAASDRFVRLLFRLRGLQPDGSIQQFMARNGFTVLEHTATTYVWDWSRAAAACPSPIRPPGGRPRCPAR